MLYNGFIKKPGAVQPIVAAWFKFKDKLLSNCPSSSVIVNNHALHPA